MDRDTLEPKIEDRKKFDLDLKYGKVKEKIIADMLQDKKIEVKSERGMWLDTGNIAIEFESYGKPSGITSTESDYWFHNLCIGEEIYGTLVFKTDMLKKIIKNTPNKREVSGGDNKASKMYLMNIQKLFNVDIIKKSVDNDS
jgi:hypothetical protein|tara:strand:+ start:441 stop:866 length:426 start_codon:yes stop_codon:yes gene_type:complete